MSRPNKTGLDYYPHDTDCSFDVRLRYIEALHGLIGYAVYHKILEQIYNNGYFIIAEDRWFVLFSADIKIDAEKLKLIISDCIKEGLFDAKIFKDYKVLTSLSIQRRYLKACDRRREIELIQQYLCSDDINEYKNLINDTTNLIIVNIKTQSKVKESKYINREDESFEFYKSEVEKAKQYTDKMSLAYVSFCNHVCMKNKDGSWRLPFVLKMKNQISLQEFSKLFDKTKENLDTIISKVDSLQTNVKYHGKYTDVYLTVNKWLNN